MTEPWEQEYKEIKQLLEDRNDYRSGGKPCPTKLDAKQLISRLDEMATSLKERINQELGEEAAQTIISIAESHIERLASPVTKREDVLLPLTPSEKYLQELRQLQDVIAKDSEKQTDTLRKMWSDYHCKDKCAFPDQCGILWPHIPCDSYTRCLFGQLYIYVVEEHNTPIWQHLLAEWYVPKNPFGKKVPRALEKMRNSRYYDPEEHEQRARGMWKYANTNDSAYFSRRKDSRRYRNK